MATPQEPTAQERLDSLAKPPGSLGLLEAWAFKLCLAQETLTPTADPASILVFCGDHGVKAAHASISPFPPSVSQAVFRALVAGISATGVLAAANGAHLTAVDVGIDGDVSDVDGPFVRHAKVERGTADFRSAAAMDEAAFERALAAGKAALAAEVEERGARVVAIGEVGIGNTTAAACCLAMLLEGMGMPCDDPGDCVGRGTGVDDDGMEAKRQTVREACSFHREAIEAEAAAAGAAAASSTGGPGAEIRAYGRAHARAVLRRLGGFEFVAMAGAFLEAAERRAVETGGAAAGEAAGAAGGKQHFRVVTVVDGQGSSAPSPRWPPPVWPTTVQVKVKAAKVKVKAKAKNPPPTTPCGAWSSRRSLRRSRRRRTPGGSSPRPSAPSTTTKPAVAAAVATRRSRCVCGSARPAPPRSPCRCCAPPPPWSREWGRCRRPWHLVPTRHEYCTQIGGQ